MKYAALGTEALVLLIILAFVVITLMGDDHDFL